MNLSSDQQVLWHHGFAELNVTVLTTWVLMIAMALGSKLITRRLNAEGVISRWQGALEIMVTSIEQQIKDVGLSQAREYLPFLGTFSRRFRHQFIG